MVLAVGDETVGAYTGDRDRVAGLGGSGGNEMEKTAGNGEAVGVVREDVAELKVVRGARDGRRS